MLAFTLENKYNIITMVGMHCAPNAHKALGTYPKGTIRFSFGYDNTEEEVDYTISAITDILAHGVFVPCSTGSFN